MRTTGRNTRTTSLAERYVHAATRRLRDDQRADIALELRAGIADRVDSLQAEDPKLSTEAAERIALVELGDPEALAASYAGTPQHLIGPDLFPSYVRTLKAITLVATPITIVVIALVGYLTGDGPLEILGRAAWVGFSLVVQIAFWVTLVFAIVERSDQASAADLGTEPWRPEQLPDLPSGSRAALGETVTNVVFLGILAGLVVWQQVLPFVTDGGDGVPVLDPDLWSLWLPLVLVALALEACFEIVKYRAGGIWTPTFAAVNTVTGAIFAAPIAWLAHTEQLLNPAFVAHAQSEWAAFDPSATHTIVLIACVVIWAWDSIDGWRKTRILG